MQSGATARVEYNDNYFFTAVNQTPGVNPQSAFTASVSPLRHGGAPDGNIRRDRAPRHRREQGVGPLPDH